MCRLRAPIVHRLPPQLSPLKARRSSHFTHLVERPVAEYPEGKGWWGLGKKLHPCAHSKLLAANKPTNAVGSVRARTGSRIYGVDSFRGRILEVTSHPRLQ